MRLVPGPVQVQKLFVHALPGTVGTKGDLMKLQSIRGCIVAALSVGVPLYNRGDPQGCFEAYAKAASECLAYSSTPALKESTSRIQATLSRALDLTSAQNSAEERAWTMRRALDTVLEEVAATESPRPTSANQPQTLQVQPWPLDFTRQDAADAWMQSKTIESWEGRAAVEWSTRTA